MELREVCVSIWCGAPAVAWSVPRWAIRDRRVGRVTPDAFCDRCSRLRGSHPSFPMFSRDEMSVLEVLAS